MYTHFFELKASYSIRSNYHYRIRFSEFFFDNAMPLKQLFLKKTLSLKFKHSEAIIYEQSGISKTSFRRRR